LPPPLVVEFGGDAEPQPDWEYSAVVLPFTIHLEPGEYDLQSIVVDDAGWNPDSVTLLVGGPTFTVGESPCTYVGAIGFDFYRLPPGTIDGQTDGVNEIMEAFELEGSLYLQPLESGSFILESGNAGLPPEDERPESAADCEPIPAQFDLYEPGRLREARRIGSLASWKPAEFRAPRDAVCPLAPDQARWFVQLSRHRDWARPSAGS
jgi:hypothetical protein